MVAGLRAKDFRERCIELGLDTLEERRQNQDLALAHKMVQNHSTLLQPIRGENRVRTRHAAAAHGLRRHVMALMAGTNGHQEILVLGESGRPMESPTKYCEDSPYQGGVQERTKAQQTVK